MIPSNSSHQETPPITLTRNNAPASLVPSERRALAGILVLVAIVHVWGTWWGLPGMPNSWAPDEFSPLLVRDAIEQKFSGGWQVLYPPGHVYVLAMVLAPIELLDRAGVVDFGSRLTYLVAFSLFRLTSVVMAAATLLVVFQITRELFDARSGLFAALTIGLAVPFVFYAKLANVEVPYLLWVSLSLLYCVRILARHQPRDYLLFGITAALAVGTKDQASALYPLLALIIPLSDYLRRRRAGEHAPFWRSFLNARTSSVVLAGAVTLAIIHNLAFNWTGAIERLRIMTGPITTGLQEFPNTVAGHAAMLWLGVRHLQFSLGWPLFVAAMAGVLLTLLRWRSHPRAIALLAPILSYWVFLIVPLMYHYDRYLMPIVLILSIFAGHAAAAFTRPGRLAPLRTALAAAAMAFSVAHAASVDALLVSDGRYAAERWIRDHIPAGERVLVIGYDLYLPRLDGLEVITSLEPILDDVTPAAPAYLITTSIFDEWRFRDSPRSLAFFQALTSGKTLYQLAYVARGRPRFNLLDLDGVRTNLDKINPEIRIYRRAGSVASRMDQ